jgi:hypothetical protein
MRKITAAMQNRILRAGYTATDKYGYRRFVAYAYATSPAAIYFGQPAGGYYYGIVDAKGNRYVYPQTLSNDFDFVWDTAIANCICHYLANGSV